MFTKQFVIETTDKNIPEDIRDFIFYEIMADSGQESYMTITLDIIEEWIDSVKDPAYGTLEDVEKYTKLLDWLKSEGLKDEEELYILKWW